MLCVREAFIRFLLALFLLSFMLLPVGSFAAVFNVANEAELQDALTTAQSNGEDDTINTGAGTFNTGGTTFTYTPPAAVEENFALAIVGAGVGLTILDGGGSDQVLSIDTTGLADDSNANITIMNLTVQNGNTNEDGGGLFVLTNSANVTIENCEFSNNFAEDFGGGAVVGSTSGDVVLTDNTFDNNSADSEGGTAFGGGASVSSTSGDVTLTGNTFDNNSADSGGGIASGGGGTAVQTDSGNVTLIDNIFTDNDVEFGGGGAAVSSDSGNTTLTNNIFADNSSDDGTGGGVAINSNSGDVTLTNNIFADNFADISGGGAGVAYTSAGILMIINNTLTLNSTGGRGGGLFVSLDDDVATANIFNSIVRDNTATGDGDDVFVFDDANRNNTGSPVNLFNNDLSDFFSFCVNTGGCTSGISEGNNIDLDPLFVDAANRDFHLQEGSPCIDAGDPNAPALPPATDFEGDPRDVDGDGDGTTPDMGADEFVPEGGGEGGGGGCSIAQSGVPTSIPLYLLVPVFVVMRRLLKRHRIN